MADEEESDTTAREEAAHEYSTQKRFENRPWIERSTYEHHFKAGWDAREKRGS